MALSKANCTNDSLTSNPQDTDLYNNYSNNNSDSELDSLMKDKPNYNKTFFKSALSYKGINSIELKILKSIPDVFYLIFITLITISIISFITNASITSSSTSTASSASTVNTTTTPNQPIQLFELNKAFLIPFNTLTIKALIIFSQILFLICCGSLYSLFNQRMNVPEYQPNKISNFSFILFSVLTTICAIVLCIYHQETYALSIGLGLADNMMLCFFMFSAVMTALFSFVVLTTFYDQSKSYSSNASLFKSIIAFKVICIGVMGLTFVIYISSVILASVYPQQNANDILFLYWLSFVYRIASVGFVFLFSLFVLSFRFDLGFIYNLLQFKPDIEYFIDEYNDYQYEDYNDNDNASSHSSSGSTCSNKSKIKGMMV